MLDQHAKCLHLLKTRIFFSSSCRCSSIQVRSLWEGLHPALLSGVPHEEDSRCHAAVRLQGAPKQAVRLWRVWPYCIYPGCTAAPPPQWTSKQCPPAGQGGTKTVASSERFQRRQLPTWFPYVSSQRWYCRVRREVEKGMFPVKILFYIQKDVINVHSDDLLFHSENRHEGGGKFKKGKWSHAKCCFYGSTLRFSLHCCCRIELDFFLWKHTKANDKVCSISMHYFTLHNNIINNINEMKHNSGEISRWMWH